MIRKVWPLVVAAVSLGIDAYVLAGVLPQIADSLTTTVGAIGLGVTAFTGAYAVAGTTLSKRAVRGSTKRGLLIALALFNVANLITALSPNLPVFLGSRVLSGAGAGILTAVATGAAASLVAEDQRGRPMAMVTFGLSAGTVAGVPIGMLIGEQVGWRWTMGLVVLVGVVSMAALAFRGSEIPAVPNAPGSGASAIRSPQVLTGIALAFVLGVTSLGLYTYMLPMAADRGLESWAFALIWVWGIGGVAGSMLVGRQIDAHGSRRLLPILVAALLASFVAVAVLSEPAAWIVAVLVWGATGWAGVPTLQDALTRSRPEATTTIVAFQMAAMYLGSAVGAGLGSARLAGGARAGDLPVWAVGAQVVAVVLAVAVGAMAKKVVAHRPTVVPLQEACPPCP